MKYTWRCSKPGDFSFAALVVVIAAAVNPVLGTPPAKLRVLYSGWLLSMQLLTFRSGCVAAVIVILVDNDVNGTVIVIVVFGTALCVQLADKALSCCSSN